MPVYQTNIFICDSCGKIESQTKEEDLYGDPVINSPEDWRNLVCSDCLGLEVEDE